MARYIAIVIGINQYRDSALPNLKYAKRDAELIGKFLSQQATFGEVCLFSDSSSVFQDYPTHPSRYELRKFLRERFEHRFLDEQDHIWFFFSGHGICHQDRDYLFPEDGDPNEPRETAIELHWVTERLIHSGAGNIVLILDACRHQLGMKGESGFGREQQKGVTTIYSCKRGEASWELDEPISQGSFTHELLRIFEQQNNERCLTIRETEQELQQRVPALNQKYGKRKQTPHIQISQTRKERQILLPHLKLNKQDDGTRAIISYQQTSNRLIFATNSKLATAIAAWETNVMLAEKTIDDLIDSATGNPSLTFAFRIIDSERVHLTVYHPYANAIFEAPYQGGLTAELQGRERDQYFRSYLGSSGIFAEIDEKMYDSLKTWQHWVDEDALTGRYIYYFSNNPTWDLEWRLIYDRTTEQTLRLAYNYYNDQIFVNKTFPEIMEASWWTTVPGRGDP